MKKSFLVIIMVFGMLFIASSAALATDGYYIKSNPVHYTLVQRTVLVNQGHEVSKNIVLHLPLMDSNMPLYQDFVGEQLSPYPDEILYDKTGGNGSRDVIYYFDELAPGEKVVVEQRYVIVSYSMKYDIRNVPDIYSDKPSAIYVEPSLFVESDCMEIKDFAEQVLSGGQNPYTIAKNLFSQVNLYMTYTEGENANKGALNAVRTGQGVCEDYTDLYVALLRSLDIPARQMTGYLYIPDDTNQQQYVKSDGTVDLTRVGHTWPEFYLHNNSWVMADPTFTYIANIGGVDKKFVDWGFFANIPDSRHYIFFREGSASEKHSYYDYEGGKVNAEFSAFLRAGDDYVPFNDLVGHWAVEAVSYLYSQEPPLVAGVGNGLYGVDLPITRAQLAVFLQRVKKPPQGVLTFTDVSAAHWAASAIAAAQAQGWLIGYDDGTFRPNEELTRAELSVVLVRAFNVKPGNQSIQFEDVDMPGYAWAKNSIMLLASNGLAGGDGMGHFMPEKNVTRAEFAVFFSKILQQYE